MNLIAENEPYITGFEDVSASLGLGSFLQVMESDNIG
jgi:hypothetical protein